VIRFRNLIILFFICTLGIIFSALFWLLSTNNGARWALAQVPHLSAKKISGTLIDGLKISELNWSSGASRFTAQNLQWVLHPSHLLWGELDVADLKIVNGQLYLLKSSSKPSKLNLTWPALPLWSRFIAIHIGPTTIEKLLVWQGQKTAFKLTSSTFKNISWNHGNIHIDELIANLSAGKLKFSAQVQMEKRSVATKGDWIEPSPAHTSLHWSVAWHAMGNNTFGGPINLILNQKNSLSSISGLIQIAPHQIVLNSMELKNPSLSNTTNGFWKIDLPENSAGDFTVYGKLSNIVVKDIPKSVPTGPLSLKIHLHGSFHHYIGAFAMNGSPKFGGIQGNIKGSETGLEYDYAGDMLGAKLLPAKIKIDWQPLMNVQGELRIRGLQNQRIFSTIPGQLSCNMTLNAAQAAKSMNGRLQLQMLPSQIYKTNLIGNADLRFSGNQWDLQNANFRGPGLTINASGNLQKHLSFSFNIAKLQMLLPDARGSTNAHGWIARTNQNWVGSINAHAQKLLYAGIAIRKVNAQASLLTHDNLQANLQIEGAEYKQYLINLHSQAHGTLAQFGMDIEAQSDGNEFTLHSLIKHSHSAWILLLNRSHFQSKSLGLWQLENASTLSWNSGVIRISPLVFNDTHGAKISVQGFYNPAQNLASLNLNVLSLPLDFNKKNNDISLEGYLNAHLQAQCHGVCHAEGNWDSEKTQLHWLSDDVPQSIDLQQFSGQVRWEPKNLTLTSHLELPKNWGSAQIYLHSPVTLALPWRWNQQAALQTTVQAKLGAPLFAALPIGTLKMRAQGSGNIEGNLTGTWADPKWHGTAELQGLGLYVPQAGLDLQDVGAKLLGNGQELQISNMHATSGTGRISGNGTIYLRPETHFALKITGHEFTALNLPQVQAAVSPDLHIDGTLQKINIGGAIHTNRLRILGTDFNGPKPSGDVVFVKNINKNYAGPALSVNLQVTLGNDAKVFISGLRADLVGALDVRMQDGNSPVVKGILRMVNGHYDIYGHSLNFERGSINFHGEASQANLDVLAVRTIKNSDSFAVDNTPVKAGVQVTGTLQVPQVNLYSNPSMSQADILSYLVLGTPSSSLGNQDELLSAAAGTLFSASRAALFGNSLSNTGIDVGVTSNGQQGLSGAMVTLGHYLTPDLYLSVGQSVMGNGTVARLRYRVSKHIELQTENGTQNGANIFYRIDF